MNLNWKTAIVNCSVNNGFEVNDHFKPHSFSSVSFSIMAFFLSMTASASTSTYLTTCSVAPLSRKRKNMVSKPAPKETT